MLRASIRDFYNAILFIAISALWTGAAAQNVYKCGNSYSQTPCFGATLMDAQDSRTPTEKAERDATTLSTSRAANKMEQERLALEQKDNAANTPPHSPVVATAKAPDAGPKAAEPAKKPKLSRPAKPDAFTAVVPGTQKPHKAKPRTKKTVARPTA